MVNFGPLAAEIRCRVWGKFQWLSRLGSITARHSSSGVSQSLWRWTKGTTFIWKGGHHVGH